MSRPGNAIQSMKRLPVFHLFRGEGLKARAMRGSAWTMVGVAVGQILRLGSNIILTHLLFPKAFGLMALVAVFMRGIKMFSDIGIAPNIIQSKRGDDPVFLNTAWTIGVMRGLALFVLACIGAWPFAAIYDDSVLLWIIPVAGFCAIIGGFNSTAIATASRKLTLGRLTTLEIVVQVVGIVVMIGCALVWRSVWSLVIGGVAASTCRVFLSQTWLSEIRNRFCWDRAASREIIRFGKWIFISTAVTFIAGQADRLLLGKLVSIEMLGIYSLGVMLATMPRMIVDRLSASVLLPALSSQARKNREQLREKIEEARRIILPAAMVMVLGIALFAPEFFRYLYDDRYHEAGWIAQLMCVSIWIAILTGAFTQSLLAIGRTAPLAAANAADSIMTILGCVIGFTIFGIVGLIAGFAAGSLSKLIVLHIAMSRSDLNVVKQDLCYSGILAGFLLVGGLDWGSLFLGNGLIGNGFGSFPPASILSFLMCGVWVAFALRRRLFGASRG